MTVAFTCVNNLQFGPTNHHHTTFVMRRCTRCGQWATAGYQCLTCDHEDVDPADKIPGHGPELCEPIGDTP